MFEKEVYEAPSIEITEFELSSSIAESGNPSQGALGFDEIWGANDEENIFSFSLLAFITISATVVAAARPTNVSVTITSSFDNVNKDLSHSVTSLPVGSVFSLNAGNIQSSYTFAFWVINGIVRNDLEATDTIRLQTSMNIQAVFYIDGQHAVLFVDSNGKLISTQYVTSNGTVIPPSYAGFSKPGLTINEAQPWKSLDGQTSFELITNSRVYVLQYQAEVAPITLTITGGVATPANPNRNDVVTLVASDIPNFKYWKDGNGNVLSYLSTFVFTATKNTTIVAETVDNKTPQTLVTMSADLAIRDNYETYVGRFELEEGHELVEWGFLLSSETLGLLTFTTPNVVIAKSNLYNPTTNEFVMSFSELTYSSIRAYVIVDNGTSLEEIFSLPSVVASDLLISEYLEGNSNNKAIEIYNGTGSAIDLSLYSIELYSNGASSASNTLTLTGILQDGDVYVVYNSSSIPAIISLGDVSSTVTFFNGDDAVALLKNGLIIDIIGVKGEDPGSAWVDGLVTTLDKTLTRKTEIIAPNTTFTATEWDVHPIDTISDLGSHSIGGSTDSQKVVVDSNDLSLPSTVKTNTTLTLSTLGANGSTITWSSDTPEIITNAGVVTLPLGQPETVIITATLTLNDIIKDVVFEIMVGLTDSEKATSDRDSISLTLAYNSPTTVSLPTIGAFGSTITWSSNNVLINVQTGNIDIPESGQVEVTVTATINNGLTELTREFIITLIAPTQQLEEVVLYTTGWEDGVNENSYSVGPRQKTSNSLSWTISYGNIVSTGTPLIGSFNLMLRVGSSASTTPYFTMTSNYSEKEISEISFTTNSASNGILKIYYKQSTGDWVLHSTLSNGTAATAKTIVFDTVSLNVVNVKIEISYASTLSSNRDARFDGLTIKGYENPVTPPTDSTAPVITISNDAIYNYTVGDTWSTSTALSWCSATDAVDGNVPCQLNDTQVDTQQAGTYTITYTAADSSNNEAILQKTITVTESSSTGLTMTGYYSAASGLTDSALISQLRTIINTNFSGKNYDYAGSGEALWDTDLDPNNLNNLIEMYTGQSRSGTWDAGVTYNREHVWPQSLLGVSAGGVNAASDLHNLKPADNSINSSRGNKFYDLVTSTDSYYPTRTEIHGDIARILFYMVIMYDEYSLVSTTPNIYQMGKLSTLLQWHLDDPVDAFELRRNERIQYHQGNRNPFIDYPELINYMNIGAA